MQFIVGMIRCIFSRNLRTVVRISVKAGCLHMNCFTICVLVLLAGLMTMSMGSSPAEVIWAVNCGGDAHVDEYGIAYMRDPLQRVGVASDFGRSLLIQRVPPPDQILYQTERYNTQSFTYDVPISREGDYVLVLKFCEVWFTQPNQKVVKTFSHNRFWDTCSLRGAVANISVLSVTSAQP